MLVPVGKSIGHTVAELAPERALWPMLRVTIDGWEIAPERWASIRPKRTVEITIVPAGGGETLRMVLMIAVIAVAVGLGAWIAAPAGMAALGITSATAASVAGAVVTTAVSTAGMLALNALIPVSTPEIGGGNSRTSPFYALDAASNQLWKYRPVPILLGQMRITPPLGAETRSETVGDDSYLNAIVIWSQGKVALSDIRIGDVAITEYREVQHDFRQASLSTAPTFPRYTRDVHEERVELQLKKSDGYITRQAQDGASRIEIEIWFLRGLIGVGKKTGDQFAMHVEVEVQTRLDGETAWVTRGTPDWSDLSNQAIRKAFSFDVPVGNYEVRVRRRTDDSNEDRLVNDSWWGVLRSFRPQQPVLAKFVSSSNFRVLGTNQLQGRLDQLNGLGMSVLLDWDSDSDSWVERATNNPASLFRYICQFPTQPYPLSDDRVDLAYLQEWHEYCVANKLTCNVYYDWGGTTDEALQLVARCGRATPVWRDGRRSVMWDKRQTIIRQRFTPRNVANFQATRSFAPPIHGYRVKFRNEEKDYQQDERIVYFDGYSSSNASRFEEMDAQGITDSDAVWRFGRWCYGQWKLRPETYSFRTDFEYLAIARGDLVEIQHDGISVGAGAGRIVSVQRVDELITFIRLDDSVPFDPGLKYNCVIHLNDATRLVFALASGGAGATRDLEVETPFEDARVIPGGLAMVGIRTIVAMPAIVRDIQPLEDLAADITCVPAAWFDEEERIPPFDSRLTNPPGLSVPIITAIRSDDAAATRDADGSIRVQIVLSFYSDGSRTEGRITEIEVNVRDLRASSSVGQLVSAPAEATEVRLYSVQVGVTYGVQARYRFATGRAGAWSAAIPHLVVGPTLPPPDASIVYLDGDLIRVRYDNPDPDHAGFRWRWTSTPGTAWNNAEALTDALVVEQYIDVASLPLATNEVLVRAETRSGLISAQAGRLLVSAANVAQRLLLYEAVLGGDGVFPGVVDGGDVGALGVLEADDSNLWLDPPDAIWLVPPEGIWLAPQWKRLAWVTSTRLPATALRTDRVFLSVVANPAPKIIYRWGEDELHVTEDDEPIPDDFLLQPDDAPIGTSGAAENPREWQAYRDGIKVLPGERLQIQISIEGGGDVDGRPTITSARIMVDAEEIEEALPDQAIPAAGLTLALQKPYRAIKYVLGTIHAGGAATQMLIDSKARPPEGPEIHLENALRQRVAGVADLRVGGV